MRMRYTGLHFRQELAEDSSAFIGLDGVQGGMQAGISLRDDKFKYR